MTTNKTTELRQLISKLTQEEMTCLINKIEQKKLGGNTKIELVVKELLPYQQVMMMAVMKRMLTDWENRNAFL